MLNILWHNENFICMYSFLEAHPIICIKFCQLLLQCNFSGEIGGCFFPPHLSYSVPITTFHERFIKHPMYAVNSGLLIRLIKRVIAETDLSLMFSVFSVYTRSMWEMWKTGSSLDGSDGSFTRTSLRNTGWEHKYTH